MSGYWVKASSSFSYILPKRVNETNKHLNFLFQLFLSYSMNIQAEDWDMFDVLWIADAGHQLYDMLFKIFLYNSESHTHDNYL